MLEKTLEEHLQQKASFEEWHKFRENLIGLTDVTGSHFDKLVQVSPCHWAISHSPLCRA